MTDTIYTPLHIWVKDDCYDWFKQRFVGNLLHAKEEKKKLEKEYPKPKYLVKRISVVVTVYKKF